MAASSGLRHRALLPIAGVPMLERVVGALVECTAVSSVAISSDDPDLVRATPALAAHADRGYLAPHGAASSPAASVAAYAEETGGFPILVTTADHPLLTPEILGRFLADAGGRDADLVVGLVPATVYRARFPDQPRTFIPLRGEKYSGANLFLLRTARAAEVARFWVRAEVHRKEPWRLAGTFGWTTLALFAARALDLDAALARASAVVGARVAAVLLPFAEAALDVDKEEDRVEAERVLACRAGR